MLVSVMDDDACYEAARSRDARFDGVFFGGVRTTGIYCRPSCPAVTPKRANMTFYRTAAAAQAAGYRSCKRCRPDAAPGSPEWNVRADVVSRAMRLISDGVVDREGVGGLAGSLGYSERHLNRQLAAEVGAGPLALARAQRARTARTLLETTALSVTDVAFAAGFASVRQFNDTIRDVFAATPTQLRARRHEPLGDSAALKVRLPFRQPLDAAGLLRFLGKRAVPGIEEYSIDALGSPVYRRSLRLPHGFGIASLTAGPADASYLNCEFALDDLRDLAAAVQRCRRLLDLDCDPRAIDEALGSDPVLAPLVAVHAGRRMPGTVDADEIAVRIVIGQQVSVAGARTIAGRLTERYGELLAHPIGSVTHAFPSAAALAQADPGHLPMPNSRKRAIKALTDALATGQVVLGPGSDWDEASAALIALHGIGPWTVAAIRMRGLGDPDVCLSSDLGIKYAVEKLGFPSAPADIDSLARQWKPWRSYATHHLWASLEPEAAADAEVR